jgi:hypothetical protein
MAFNHYATLKRIIRRYGDNWYIMRIDEPTTTTNFKGEKVTYPHYYRLYTSDGKEIKYGKFQKLEKLAKVLDVDEFDLPIINA